MTGMDLLSVKRTIQKGRSNMKSVLITGPTGAVGQALIRKCLEEQVEVTAVCRPDSPRAGSLPESALLELVSCDLGNLAALPRILEGRSFDVFYHLAWAGTFGDSRQELKSQWQNIGWTLDAADAAHALGCRRFIGAGSQAEYGRNGGPLKAETPAFPENGYGAAKLCAGQMSRLRCEQLGMDHIWTRILSVYGPYDGKDTLIMYAIRTLLKGEIPALSAGEQIWDYLYSGDAGEALFLLGEKGRAGKTYPLGSGEGRPLKEYILELRDQIDPQAELDFGKIPYGPKQVMHLCADLSELTEDTGFSCRVPFREGIARTIEWYRRNSRRGNA